MVADYSLFLFEPFDQHATLTLNLGAVSQVLVNGTRSLIQPCFLDG